MERKNRVPHPGEVLQRTFIDPNGLGINQLARYLGVPAGRVSTIVNGQRAVSADTAVRLARFFGTTALYWMNLQARYDLAQAEESLERQAAAPIPTMAEVLAQPAPVAAPEKKEGRSFLGFPFRKGG
ncbi:HigA family addiction module antitoxin [Phaeovibrio sulfidiphilus]|uniref:HigA family addiction module antitoxin n=1 Tax=Phaeovibrio sulfidiphilus TaxID=1220600 RepID=UPI0030846558